MREYPLRVVGAMVASGYSIDRFIEGRTRLSEVDRSGVWLSAWSESGRENRLQRVAELIDGERHLAGRVGANGGVDRRRADHALAERNEFRLGVGV
jgi:hypothetical protein